MRFRWLFLVAALAILLALTATVVIGFSEFESPVEPRVNGVPLRRYVVTYWSPSAGELTLGPAGADAIPWLIKGLDAKDSSLYKLKVRVWKLVRKQQQLKWRRHEPINAATLRLNCVRVLEMFGPEAAAAAPKLIEFAESY